ncbi:MAG: hypothetical protein V3S11_04315 [Elusimicrobiota bacterium]
MIYLTAATPWESRPLARILGLSPEGDGLYRGHVDEREVLLIETGMGPLRTKSTLAALGSRNGHGESDTVLSTGFAGALQPGIHAGEIVADMRGTPVEFVQAARAVAEEQNVPLHLGALISVERVVAEPEEKRRLGLKERAVAVDMESSAVRAWARARRANFAVVRSVLDGVDQRLPSRTPKSTALPDIANYLWSHGRELPLLLRLAWLQRKVIRTLGRFLDGFISRIDIQERNAQHP